MLLISTISTSTLYIEESTIESIGTIDCVATSIIVGGEGVGGYGNGLGNCASYIYNLRIYS
jgi:hypothetical protein